MTLNLPFEEKKETLLKSFAFARKQHILSLCSAELQFFSNPYTLKTELLCFLSATDSTHISTWYTRASVRCICSDLFTSWNPGEGVHAPPSLSQGYLFSVCTQKCKSKHLPSAACLSFQVPLFPSSTLPRIILLTVVVTIVLLLSLHHLYTSWYSHWVFVLVICVNVWEDDLAAQWLTALAVLCLKHDEMKYQCPAPSLPIRPLLPVVVS